jgi:hypothetical protein
MSTSFLPVPSPSLPGEHADTLMVAAVYFPMLPLSQTLAVTKLPLLSLPQLLWELQCFQAPEANGRQMDYYYYYYLVLLKEAIHF